MLKKEENTLHSSHIFMFPFRFDWNAEGFKNEYEHYKEKSVNERICLEKFHHHLTEKEKIPWQYKPFKIENEYNEYAYFYDYTRDALYNKEEFSTDALSNYYEKDELIGEVFELNLKETSYRLNIASVSLRVFSTGVAILSLELENYDSGEFEDILNINDFGRRVYPQYINDGKVEATKDSFLASNIKIPFLNIEENFEREVYDDTYMGQHIMQLLGEQTFSQNMNDAQKYYIQPSLDDRMFVISWYGNDALSSELQSDSKHYGQSDDWYRYLFVDNNDVTIKNNAMKEKLLQTASYDRWSDYGTLYGLSRYSFVCLTNTEWFSTNVIKVHMGSMYFQMMILLLATRTSILRFSDEIAALASHETIDTQKLSNLYQRYLTFYNRLYFKEVTHQEQGIELYDIARKQMKIDEHIEKFDGKFTKLFAFAKIQSEELKSSKMDKLTLMGSIFLPPSLMIALFSMGIFQYEQSEHSLYIAVVAMVVSILITIGYINFKEKAKKVKEMIFPAIVITVITLLMVLVPIKLIGEKVDKVQEVRMEQKHE